MQKNKYNNTIKTINKNKMWIALGVIIFIVTIIRIRLLDIPLERDEGEYAYMGQLILQHIPPYEIAYNMKFPGTYIMYAFFMSIFGETIQGVHIGLMIVNITTIFLLFLLTRKLVSEFAGIVAASVYALLSLSVPFLGFAAHATHYVILPAIAGTLLLYKAITEGKTKLFFYSGLLLGLCPIMKQQGIFFSFFGVLLLLLQIVINRESSVKRNIQRFLLFVIGGIIPFLLMIVILASCGVLSKFWFWTIEYASSYVNEIHIKDAFGIFGNAVISQFKDFYFIGIIAVLGLVALFIHPKLKKNFTVIFIILFFIFSFLSICPGFYFRSHYFVTLLPAIAILFSVSVDHIFEISKNKSSNLIKYLAFASFVIPVTIGFYAQYDYFFKYAPNMISRSIYGANPFIESINIAEYIKENSNKYDKIAILGSEPQICFYSKRHSATGYIYTYSLMEKQENSLKMQKEMASEIETAMPSYIIYVNVISSWLPEKNSESYIFDWIKTFLNNHNYKKVGIADISENLTIYKWDDECINYNPISNCYVEIFKKKN